MNAVVSRRNRFLSVKKALNQSKYDIDLDMVVLAKEAKEAQDLESAKRFYAASRLQGIVRGFLVRLFCKELRRELHALVVIQRVMRGKLGRIKWMREYWKSISVVKSLEALKELKKRSRIIRSSPQWTEYFDTLTEAFWYYQPASQLSTWNVPLVFQKTLVCNWDGFHKFGGALSDKKCRCVFDNVAEYQGHIRTAHKWYCVSCYKQNSGLVFPVCSLCGNDKSEDGDDGERALRDSINEVRNKISMFMATENVQKTNFKYKIKDRLVQLAVDKLAREKKAAEEKEEERRQRKLKKLATAAAAITGKMKPAGRVVSLIDLPRPTPSTSLFPAMRAAGGSDAMRTSGGVGTTTQTPLHPSAPTPHFSLAAAPSNDTGFPPTHTHPKPPSKLDTMKKPEQAPTQPITKKKKRKEENDPWEKDNKVRRKNILRVTGCMIPAPPLFNAEAEKWGSQFNPNTSSVAEMAADQWFKKELGGIEGERKLFIDPVTLGGIPAKTFDWITNVYLDEDVRLGLVASPDDENHDESSESDDDDGDGEQGMEATDKLASLSNADDQPGAVTVATEQLFDAWDLDAGEFGKENSEHRLLVCESFQEGRCTLKTCPRAHPGIRDNSEILFIRLPGRVKKTQYVKCCPLYTGGGPHCGCREADTCRLYHVYHRPTTADLIRLIYPIEHGQKRKVLPSGAQIDGNLRNNQLSGYGVMTWLNGASYAGDWAGDLREGFGIYRTLQGTDYTGGWLGGRRHGMGIYTNALGEEYVGEWQDGKMHGVGRLSCANGDVYEGRFKNHKFHGVGKFTKPDGSEFIGYCVAGMACGLGIMNLHSGEKYKGHFDRNFRHGKGACSYPNKSYYVGDWYRGVPTGFGVYIAPNGEKYVGQFSGGRKEGNGRYMFLDGSFYDGEFHKDKAEGVGVYYAANGDVYSGQWSNDKRNGRGTFRYNNGSVYTGNWVDNNINGKGKFDYATGCHYRGEFLNNSKHGRGIYTWPNGNVYKGQFVKDKMCGKGELTYIGGHRYTGDWEDNKKHGHGTFYYVNGAVYVGQWEFDTRQGRGRLTFLPGSFIEEYYEGEWENGEMHGIGKYVYRQDEGTVYEGDWVNGMRHGFGKISYIDGSYYKGDFQEEKMSGQGMYVGSDGSQYTGAWEDNMREGVGTMLAPDGSIYHGQYRHNMKHGHGRLQYADGNIFEGDWQGNVIVGKEGTGMSGKFTFLCGKGSRGGPEEVTLKVFPY